MARRRASAGAKRRRLAKGPSGDNPAGDAPRPAVGSTSVGEASGTPRSVEATEPARECWVLQRFDAEISKYAIMKKALEDVGASVSGTKAVLAWRIRCIVGHYDDINVAGLRLFLRKLSDSVEGSRPELVARCKQLWITRGTQLAKLL